VCCLQTPVLHVRLFDKANSQKPCADAPAPPRTLDQTHRVYPPAMQTNRSTRACLEATAPRGGESLEVGSRSWLRPHVRRFPGRNRMPGDRSITLLRARARGQRRRRNASSQPRKKTYCGCKSSTLSKSREPRAALVEFPTPTTKLGLLARHGYGIPARVRADQRSLDPNTTASLELPA
jgi:hypothetical protein